MATEQKPIVAIYELEGAVSESGKSDFSLLDLDIGEERPLTLFALTQGLGKAAQDPSVKGVVLDIDDAALGFGQLQELRGRLEAGRAAGKDIWLYTDSFNNETALLGSIANRLTLMPHGSVSFSGIFSESFYYKDFLDRIGLSADDIFPIPSNLGVLRSFLPFSFTQVPLFPVTPFSPPPVRSNDSFRSLPQKANS